ncbi:MAG: hypothetical protein J6K25_15065 [Thermoguttaceae bacterium]|nr:hypothetical protein [Thermoguttaceae bacterium]
MSSDVIASVALQVKTADALAQIGKFENRLGALKQSAASVGAAVAALFAQRKAFDFASSLVKEASNVQEARGKFRAVFKGLTDDAQKYVDELKSVYGQSELIALNSLSTSASILKNSGVADGRALEMSGELARMASDLATFTNAQGGVEQTSQALISALIGERERLKTLGIAFYEADVAAERLALSRQGVVFASEKEAKMEATLSLLRKQFADITGQTVREGDNFASQLGTLQAKFSDLKAAFGDALIEPATAAVVKLRGLAESLLKLDDSTRKNVAVFGLLGATAVPLGVALAGVAGAVKTYLNISRLAEVATTAQTTAETANASAARTATAATAQETAARNANAAAASREAAAVSASTAAKNASSSRSWAAPSRPSGVEKAAFATELYSGGWRSRLSSGGAEIAAGMRTRPSVGARALSTATNVASGPLKALDSVGKALANLIPVGGRVGLVLKGLTRFAGPIGLVVGALQALKSGPALLEKALNEWFPKIATATGNALKWVATTGIPVAAKWIGELLVGAIKGAVQIARRLTGLLVEAIAKAFFGERGAKWVRDRFPQTEAQKNYRAEKDLAEQRRATAQATEAAKKAEADRRTQNDARNKAFETAKSTAGKIELARLSDSEREFREKSDAAQERVTKAQSDVAGFDADLRAGKTVDLAKRAQAVQELQLARIDAAQLVGEHTFEQNFAALQTNFQTELKAAQTEAGRLAVVQKYQGIVDQTRQASAQTEATVNEKRWEAGSIRNANLAASNELLTEAAILEASTLTGERKEAFDAFASSVADAGKAASETLADIAKEQSASDFNQALRAAKDDGTKIAALCRERIATLQASAKATDDERTVFERNQEILALRNQATDAEEEARNKTKEALEKEKEVAKSKTELARELSLSAATTDFERANVYRAQFGDAVAAFQNAKNDDERLSAVRDANAARESLDSLEKDRAQKALDAAKKENEAFGPQSALTRGSAEAFQIENRFRNAYQEKALREQREGNALLRRIGAMLASIGQKSGGDGQATLVVEG